jgi:hypothetical protein
MAQKYESYEKLGRWTVLANIRYQREKTEASPKKEETTDKNKGIKNLEITIGTWALLSTKPINDTWASLTGENPMSVQSNFVVRSEMLWFFLHMMDRYALAIGGPEVRATLQDAIVEHAIRELVTTSFNSSHVKKGFDVEGWKGRMVSDALEDFNEAGLDYRSCTALVTENKADFSREESILGKLGARICRFTEQNPSNLNLRLLIWANAAEFLAKSKLKQQIEKLIANW